MNAILLPASDHAGRSAFFVSGTSFLPPSRSMTERWPSGLAYAIAVPKDCGAPLRPFLVADADDQRVIAGGPFVRLPLLVIRRPLGRRVRGLYLLVRQREHV